MYFVVQCTVNVRKGGEICFFHVCGVLCVYLYNTADDDDKNN